MKRTQLVLLAMSLAPLSHAASVLQQDPAAGGIGYAWTVLLGGEESVSTPNSSSAHVGAWSWEDQGLFTPGVDPTVGWTHTSAWA
jgi:hypothetical protein